MRKYLVTKGSLQKLGGQEILQNAIIVVVYYQSTDCAEKLLFFTLTILKSKNFAFEVSLSSDGNKESRSLGTL